MRKSSIFIIVSCLTLMVVFLSVSASAESPFILNSCYSPPHSNENQTGYLDLIVKEAFRRAGFTVVIQLKPAERCLEDSNAGVVDGEIGRIRELSRYYPNLVIVDEPIIESRDFVAFSVHHEFITDDWASMRPYHVGFVRGWKIFETNVMEARSIIEMDSTLSLFKLLIGDRVDVALNARIDGFFAAKQLGCRNIKAMNPPLASLELFLFMHKKHFEIIPKLETSLKGMKADGSFYRIRSEALADILGN